MKHPIPPGGEAWLSELLRVAINEANGARGECPICGGPECRGYYAMSYLLGFAGIDQAELDERKEYKSYD